MNAWFDSLNTMEMIFAISAISGGALLGLRLILQIFFGGGEGDMDALEGDALDPAFTVLSLQFLMSFALMFGLVGLYVMRQTQAGASVAIAAGTGSGVATGWLMHRIMCWMQSLQHSGTLRLDEAVGATGTVYLTIPVAGIGRIQAELQGRLIELDAVVDGDSPLPTGTTITITGRRGGAMVVRPF